MRLASLVSTIAALGFASLAACTQSVEAPADTKTEKLDVFDLYCPMWEAWATHPSTTGVIAAIHRRAPGLGGAYPTCPVVYANGVAITPYDAADAMWHDQYCNWYGTCSLSINVPSVKWGSLYTPIDSFGRLHGNFCAYDATPSSDPATFAVNVRLLESAVRAQVVASRSFSVAYTDIRAPGLGPLWCFDPGGHGCTSCD